MVGSLALLGLILAGCGGAAASNGESSSAASLVSIGAGLRGVDGTTATKYATGISHVSSLADDDEGRIWAGTADYTATGSDAVYVITTSGATPTKVITGVSTVMGLVWHDGALYVASASGVDVYRGFDGTTFAEHAVVLSVPDGTGLVGSIAFGSDGRFVVGISAPCDSCTPTSAWSGAVLSFLPDGSDVHVVASGIRVPVGLAYDSSTGALLVSMNQRDDLGNDTPGDWLAVVDDGQSWGFPGCYGQGGTVCDGAPEPLAELDAHAAASGVAVVNGAFTSDGTSDALVAEWARGVVLRVDLSNEAGTYESTSRFATGFTNPVAVIVGADGAVYVGDWGRGVVYRIEAT